MRVSQLQDQIDRGEYRVDNHAVADAIIRRLLAERHTSMREAKTPQSKCS